MPQNTSRREPVSVLPAPSFVFTHTHTQTHSSSYRSNVISPPFLFNSSQLALVTTLPTHYTFLFSFNLEVVGRPHITSSTSLFNTFLGKTKTLVYIGIGIWESLPLLLRCWCWCLSHFVFWENNGERGNLLPFESKNKTNKKNNNNWYYREQQNKEGHFAEVGWMRVV
uniref:(northern house mosquito) hypothetical protein n=1 Tax=Culex pipiens TaxID=7175 RepID=A0A8D8AJ51_CULPI